jgi:hypothetical protein
VFDGKVDDLLRNPGGFTIVTFSEEVRNEIRMGRSKQQRKRQGFIT